MVMESSSSLLISYRRLRRPLHKFYLSSYLKWGNQKYLAYLRVNNNSSTSNSNSDHVSRETSRSLTPCDDESEGRIFEKSKLSNGVIQETNSTNVLVPEKDKLKLADMVSDQPAGELKSLNDKVDQLGAKVDSMATAADSRQWNLRSRRTACKTSTLDDGKVESSSSLRKKNVKSPREKDGGEKKEKRKFSVALSKEEIEEDFMALVGRKPSRKPTKHPKQVQKQLDALFPGLFLSEVTLDSYKVP